MKTNINETNFFLATNANFITCELPTTYPDYISESGSMYWYTNEGVVRGSNHWGKRIATCNWFLDSKESAQMLRFGFCKFEDFNNENAQMLVASQNVKRMNVNVLAAGMTAYGKYNLGGLVVNSRGFIENEK